MKKSLLIIACSISLFVQAQSEEDWTKIKAGITSNDRVLELKSNLVNYSDYAFVTTKQKGLCKIEVLDFNTLELGISSILTPGISLDTLHESFNKLSLGTNPGMSGDVITIAKTIDSTGECLIYSQFGPSSNFALDTSGLPTTTSGLIPEVAFIQSSYNLSILRFKDGSVFVKPLDSAHISWKALPNLTGVAYVAVYTTNSTVKTVCYYDNNQLFVSDDLGDTWTAISNPHLPANFTTDTAYISDYRDVFVTIGHTPGKKNIIQKYVVNQGAQIWIDSVQITPNYYTSSLGNERNVRYTKHTEYNFVQFISFERLPEDTLSSNYLSYFGDYFYPAHLEDSCFNDPSTDYPADMAFLYVGPHIFCVSHLTNSGLYYLLRTFGSVDEAHINTLNLYPNPAQNYFDLPAEIRAREIEIIDLTGRTISLPYNETNRYDISGLAPGYYMVKVLDQNGNYATGKLIVQ